MIVKGRVYAAARYYNALSLEGWLRLDCVWYHSCFWSRICVQVRNMYQILCVRNCLLLLLLLHQRSCVLFCLLRLLLLLLIHIDSQIDARISGDRALMMNV